MYFFLLTTLVLLGSLTMSNGQSPVSDSCYPTTDALLADLSQKDPNESVTYTLCGNTVYDIGSDINADFECCTDGQAPLNFIGNSTIRCGDDGSSSNSCVLRGGRFQMVTVSFSFGAFYEQDNIVIQGLTFEAGDRAGILLAAEGSVTFEDCIIREQSNIGAVSALFVPPVNQRRRLDEIPSNEAHQTILDTFALILTDPQAHDEYRTAVQEQYLAAQDDEPSLGRHLQDSLRQSITFRNCLFSDNSLGDTTDLLTNPGIIDAEVPANDVIVEGCTFEDNNFAGAPGGAGYAIFIATGATLSIKDNCFINNDFVGATVILADAGSLLDSSGNFGTSDDGLTCSFVGSGTPYVCTEYESDQCIATETTDSCEGVLGFGLFSRLPNIFCFTQKACGAVGRLFRFDRLGVCTL